MNDRNSSKSFVHKPIHSTRVLGVVNDLDAIRPTSKHCVILAYAVHAHAEQLQFKINRRNPDY